MATSALLDPPALFEALRHELEEMRQSAVRQEELLGQLSAHWRPTANDEAGQGDGEISAGELPGRKSAAWAKAGSVGVLPDPCGGTGRKSAALVSEGRAVVLPDPEGGTGPKSEAWKSEGDDSVDAQRGNISWQAAHELQELPRSSLPVVEMRRGSVVDSFVLEPSAFASELLCRAPTRMSCNSRLSHEISVAMVYDGDTAGTTGMAWSPESPSRLLYEGVSLLLLVFDAFTIPFFLAWSIEEDAAWNLWGMVSRLFWAFDLLLSFLTGYWETLSALELRLQKTAMRYLQTSFLLDLCIVILDWASLLMPRFKSARLGRLGRLVRIGRQVKRAAKIAYIVKSMKLKKEVHLLIDIGAIMVAIFWLAHIWSCVWYQIGLDVEGSDTGGTWLTSNDEFDVGRTGYIYFTSLHWSLTQITPGSMEVFPKSTRERIYNVAILSSGLILGTSLIAMVTSMMTQYRLGLEASTKNFRMLETYLEQVGATSGLSRVVKAQVVARLTEAKRLKAEEVSYLGLASNSLRQALWCQVCMGHLEPHPFWSAWGRMNTACLLSFSNAAMEVFTYVQRDIVFEEGRPASKMYIIVTGELTYVPGFRAVERLLQLEGEEFRLSTGTWCVELALWVKWKHSGTMHCIRTAELLCVDPMLWDEDSKLFPEARAVLASYARAFTEHLKLGEARSDLVHSVNYRELISEIPHGLRLKMSRPLFKYLEDGHRESAGLIDPMSELRLKPLPPHKLRKLQIEVEQGKCDIAMVDGELVRSVIVVAMKIYREDFSASLPEGVNPVKTTIGIEAMASSRFLVKVAELHAESNSIDVRCGIPGSKRLEHESIVEAMERVVQSDLISIAPCIKWSANSSKEVDQFFRKSATYGIRTHYTRTVFSGFLRNSLDPFTLPVSAVHLEDSGRERQYFCSFLGAQQSQETHSRVIRALEAIREVVVLPTTAGKRDLCIWLRQRDLEVVADDRSAPLVQRWATAVRSLSSWDSGQAFV